MAARKTGGADGDDMAWCVGRGLWQVGEESSGVCTVVFEAHRLRGSGEWSMAGTITARQVTDV